MPIKHKFFSTVPKVEDMQRVVAKHKARFDCMERFAAGLQEAIVTAYLQGESTAYYALAKANIDVDGVLALERELLELNFTPIITHPGNKSANLKIWVAYHKDEDERGVAVTEYIRTCSESADTKYHGQRNCTDVQRDPALVKQRDPDFNLKAPVRMPNFGD